MSKVASIIDQILSLGKATNTKLWIELGQTINQKPDEYSNFLLERKIMLFILKIK